MTRANVAASFEAIIKGRARAALDKNRAATAAMKKLTEEFFVEGLPLNEEASTFLALSSAGAAERDVIERAVDETISRVSSAVKDPERDLYVSLIEMDMLQGGVVVEAPSRLAASFDDLVEAIEDGNVVKIAGSRKALVGVLCEAKVPDVETAPVDPSVLRLAERKFVERHGDRAPILLEWAAGSPAYRERASGIVSEAIDLIDSYSASDEAKKDGEMAKKLSEVREIASRVDPSDRGSIADVLLLADLSKEIKR